MIVKMIYLKPLDQNYDWINMINSLFLCFTNGLVRFVLNWPLKTAYTVLCYTKQTMTWNILIDWWWNFIKQEPQQFKMEHRIILPLTTFAHATVISIKYIFNKLFWFRFKNFTMNTLFRPVCSASLGEKFTVKREKLWLCNVNHRF